MSSVNNTSLQGKSLPVCICTKKQKTPLCSFGSLTLEAAVVLPILTGFLMMFLFLFRVLQVQRSVQEALNKTCREAAVTSAVTDGNLNYLVVEAMFWDSLKEDPYVERYVSGGPMGIYFMDSEVGGEYVELQVLYDLTLPVGFFQIREISMIQGCTGKKWTGRPPYRPEKDSWVYVTRESEVYHTSKECQSLKLSTKQTTLDQVKELRNKDGSCYQPCPYCGKKEGMENLIYITDYGTFYHRKSDCLSLRRTVQMIPMEEIGGRRLCYYCEKRAE